METIEHVHCPVNVFAHGTDVSGRHVGGDGLDLGVRPTQPFPEGFQTRVLHFP
jgi:hypothetical protein